MDIYQQLWNADQQGNGIRPLRKGMPIPADSNGHVVVDTAEAVGPTHSLLTQLHLPASKSASYDLCKALFNNYVLDQTKPDNVLTEEPEEVNALLDHTVQTPVSEVARLYAQEQTGETFSMGRWRALLHQLWFVPFSMGNNPHLTGFEHTFIGEQKGGALGGYHYWHKYYLDDQHGVLPTGAHGVPGSGDDVEFLGYAFQGANAHEGKLVPEVVTMKYRVMAFDYLAKVKRPLTKPIGGFFVGISPEGLLAMGAVRAVHNFLAPKEGIINSAQYKMMVHHSTDHNQIRTFYPEFLDLLDAVPPPSPGTPPPSPGTPPPSPGTPAPLLVTPVGSIRIVAAMVNPVGNDVGFETVVLVNAQPAPISIEGWMIEDKNGKRERLTGSLPAADFRTIKLSGLTTQLSNEGGSITLRDAAGQPVHSVPYSRSQASQQGALVVFAG